MTNYTIRTDADLTTIAATDIDAAARAWATSERITGVETADDLLRSVARIDGAWIWIEDEDGDRIGGSTEGALRDYLGL